jgi:glyoxylase-like metal-dependent hydrolase (beta-lactamase superfamily II)
MVDRVRSVVLSRFGLDGGAMFGIVPKPLWQKTNPADAQNRIRMAARCLVLDIGERRVLVDTGMGNKWSPREASIYAVPDENLGARDALSLAGIDPDSISDVVLTHLHFDHAGGLTELDAEGRPRPAFARATHWVQRENWFWARHPSSRDAGSYRGENFDWMVEGSGPRVELVEGRARILDALELLPSHGHTPGMQLVRFTHQGETITYCADLVPTLGHLPVVYVMGYDLYPVTSTHEKRLLLNEVAAGGLLAVEHDPDHSFARIQRTGTDRFETTERLTDLC